MQDTKQELKRISPDAIPRALQKAERYRLLNQPWATESICHDILKIKPDHQEALVMLLLSITDQFGSEPRELSKRAHEVLGRLTSEYERHYYDGIIHERLGHAQMSHDAMHAHAMAAESLRKAMREFERAEALEPAENDDAILRWNTCARTLERLRADDDGDGEYHPVFGE